jgi:hypothetical protein
MPVPRPGPGADATVTLGTPLPVRLSPAPVGVQAPPRPAPKWQTAPPRRVVVRHRSCSVQVLAHLADFRLESRKIRRLGCPGPSGWGRFWWVRAGCVCRHSSGIHRGRVLNWVGLIVKILSTVTFQKKDGAGDGAKERDRDAATERSEPPPRRERATDGCKRRERASCIYRSVTVQSARMATLVGVQGAPHPQP